MRPDGDDHDAGRPSRRRAQSPTRTASRSSGRSSSGATHPYWEWGSQEVRTDDRGVYRLPPLPRGPLTITVVARGWMPALKKVDLQPGMKPVDFRLEPGKELRVRFVDRPGKPIPGVSVTIDRWRGGESLYNHRHPNVLDTQIPNQTDEAGLYLWTWAPDDSVTYQFWKEGYVSQEVDLTATGSEQTVTLHSRPPNLGKGHGRDHGAADRRSDRDTGPRVSPGPLHRRTAA